MHRPPDVPGYLIRDVLGSGGCATVYLATQVVVGRDVAVKIDNRTLSTDRDRRRFYREVNAAGRLSEHPHVIGLYDAGTLPDGRPYLVMELCTGGSLATVLRRRGGLPPDEVHDMGVGLADALGAAHGLGVLHRDLKPGNILVNRYGMVGLADFGLASIITADTEQSATLESLTPAYAPPEAFALAEPAPTADVYSFGATLYALLNGRPARFPETGSPSLVSIVRMHDEPLPLLPWVPPPLMGIVERAMAPNPADRYPDGDALRSALTRASVSVPTGPGVRTSAASREYATGGPVAAPPARPFSSTPTGQPFSSANSVSVGFTGPGSSGDLGGTGGRGGPAGPPTGAPITGGGGPAAPGPVPPRRRGALVAAVAAGAAVVLVALIAGVAWTFGPWQGDDPDTNARPSASEAAADDSGVRVEGVDYGVETTTANCPAAARGARCVVEPECWSGMVVIVGQVTIERLSCDDLHQWETFAIAPLPQDALTSSQKTLAAHPTVRALCTDELLRASVRRPAAGEWQVDVLPPSEQAFADGARVYRCVAAVINPDTDGTTGSAFTA
ncbi:serine/threonine-protein kinase [Cryptosporangium minutisporangium]|uniref:serine/threonine-protein kinase n=1 Tax=Cryptosporangium minutisporangium TaxID=113569 RepID=UPI0035EC41AA